MKKRIERSGFPGLRRELSGKPETTANLEKLSAMQREKRSSLESPLWLLGRDPVSTDIGQSREGLQPQRETVDQVGVLVPGR